MQQLRARLRRFSWIALLAQCALAFAPTLSHALAFAQGGNSNLSEVCTPQGAQLIALDDLAGEAGAPSSGLRSLEHCAYCALGASMPGLSSAPQCAHVPPGVGVDMVPGLRPIPRTRFAWFIAQPRAPPQGLLSSH